MCSVLGQGLDGVRACDDGIWGKVKIGRGGSVRAYGERVGKVLVMTI